MREIFLRAKKFLESVDSLLPIKDFRKILEEKNFRQVIIDEMRLFKFVGLKFEMKNAIYFKISNKFILNHSLSAKF